MTELDLKIGCEFLETCPDTIKLKENPGDKDLEDQYEQLCTTCGYRTCLRYKEFSNQGVFAQNGRT